MKDKVKLTGLLLQAGSIILFSSSFFIRVNNTAVNRRYWALGIGIVGLGVTMIPKLKSGKSK